METDEVSTGGASASGPRKRQRLARASEAQSTPSCNRCREKKIKCDAAVPTCRHCTKAGATCLVIDSGTGKIYTRSEILSIQERIKLLQETLCSRGVEVNSAQVIEPINSIEDGDTPRSTRDLKHTPRFIGDESGTGFIQYILHAIRHGWKDTNFTQPGQEAISGPAIVDHPPHPLPDASDGAELITAYLTNFHIEHPFLERKAVTELYTRVYEHPAQAQETFRRDTPTKKHDLFQINLIYALATIENYRKNLSDKHPFGFLTAGLRYLDGSLKFESIQDIQGFLLIARFGLYYYIGCSIWEISQICLRICIDLGLHKKSRSSAISLLEEHMRRRVFWECYLMDRFSSVTLGRPFGIEDSDIEIGLPFDADDEQLKNIFDITLIELDNGTVSSSNIGDTAVFNLCVRLGRITSRIHSALHFRIQGEMPRNGDTISGSTTTVEQGWSAGYTYQLFRGFYLELKLWRQSCPFFSSPQCAAQTQDWFQFLYEREKLTLIRAAIDQVHSRSTFPPKELLNPCHNTAITVIQLYNDMRKKGLVTYSWSYLQLMLSCGLSVIFCVFVKLDRRSRDTNRVGKDRFSHWWTDLEPEKFRDFSLEESSMAINACAEVHSWMGDQAREMAIYARFFNMMRKGIQEKIKQSDIARFNVSVESTPNSRSDRLHPHCENQLLRGNIVSNIEKQNTLISESLSIPREVHDSTHVNVNPDNMAVANSSDIGMGSGIGESSPIDWPSVGSENAFEPLVRQLFGTGAASYDVQDMEFFNGINDFSTWQFPQEPLLAEFTSGLEGFMWEAAPP